VGDRARVAVPPPLLAGRYEVGGLLGAGGMAQVHRARDRVLHRPVAVKLLPPGGPAAAVDRFRAEGRRHAAVRHPGVLPVLDAGADAGWHYLVLELAEGGSLAQLLRRRPVLPAAEAAVLLRQVAAALAAAHRVGVVHRDVKPGNVLLDDEGRARLTDFGISLGAGDLDGLPADQVLGTREYLSPERLRGAPATPADDVWAVSVLGHQLLTGRPPTDAPPPLPDGIPAALRTALTAAVADDPTRRPADGAALAELLTDASDAPVAAPPTATPAGPATDPDVTRLLPVPARTARGRRAAAVLTGCVLAGGALASAFPGVAAALVR
jgi:serine/threonine-protein kinase